MQSGWSRAVTSAAVMVALVLPTENADAETPESIEAAYATWAARHEARGGDRNVALRLGWSKAYSLRHTSASGVAQLDLVRGSLRVEIDGLGSGGGDVWLIDNPAAGSAAPEPSDAQVFVGALAVRGRSSVLAADLRQLPAEFQIDLVAVTQSGATPSDGGLLFGAPGLWQRRYTDARRGRSRGPGSPSLAQLVRRGEALFFGETFGGNGRTCGTCHPAENNFTIDPDFIAKLHDDDPLFVAEYVPELARNFEKPALMRGLALILENTNGFENPESNFTMRSVSHTLALPTSVTPDEDLPAENATGWSGDGAPSGGSLRQFANGAIRQHLPKTTRRIEGVDFRFATDDELDALEAFQLSLGRNRDPDVTPGSPSELRFRSPLAELGKDLFNDTDTSDGSAGKCARCHNNAGATGLSSQTNDNFDTGIESLPGHPADSIVASTGDANLADNPPDDGLGSPGDGTFNTPSLVEAADTGPYFHDNAAETLEAAIDFYNSATFTQSRSGRFLASSNSGEPNGVAIHLEPEEVIAVAAFLRALNALENIRSANEAVRSAEQGRSTGDRLETAAADVADAAEVLSAGGLHVRAERELRVVEKLLLRAAERPRGARAVLSEALVRLASARQQIVAR